jgi:hypothetical protein
MTNTKENCMSARGVMNVPYEGNTVYMNASEIRNEKYVFPINGTSLQHLNWSCQEGGQQLVEQKS